MVGRFVIFLTVALSLHGAVNTYIFMRGWQALPQIAWARALYLCTAILLALSYPAARILERVRICAASDALIWIGSFWFAFMLYLFLSLVLIDLARLGDRLFHWFPNIVLNNMTVAKRITALTIVILAAIAVTAGALNARAPRLTVVDLELPKKKSKLDSLTVALATDIHLGTIIHNSRLEQLIALIAGTKADLVLFAGDIVDEDLAPVIQQNMGELLRTIPSRLGVYAVTGNHEYIGGANAACRYLEEHGITVLRDRAVTVADSLTLIGREDRTVIQFTGRRRAALTDIMASARGDLPVIMMDHQPFSLEVGEGNGVDLQVSGHTHDGQLWPVNYITNRIFEVSYGYKRRGSTHVYVSSGYGTWGPPVRLGNRPEVVLFRIRFK